MPANKVLLIIMDGYGQREDTLKNAIAAAKKPHIDAIMARWPHTLIGASGLDVGLPRGQMGNSEVGHTNIGAGRIVYQELSRINLSIEDGSINQNPAFTAAIDSCLQSGKSLHLMGLLSDGGVHSHINHLFALTRLAASRGLQKIYIHCFMDGRDTLPTSGAGYLSQLWDELAEIGVGEIATVMGRYYAMDRDNRWDRVKLAYDALTHGIGERGDNPVKAVEDCYLKGITDEFLLPMVFSKDGKIKDGDTVIFFNFRPDRAREITSALTNPDFDAFSREDGLIRTHFVAMTEYQADMPGVVVAYPPGSMRDTLGEYLSSLGLKQLRIAETEKYAHVTFFFNGGNEMPYPGEDRLLVPSPKVATYDLMPQMSALEVMEKLLPIIDSAAYDLIVLNFANCDMVGHTGSFDATIKAVETVDACVGSVVERAILAGAIAVITADHGNADMMITPENTPFTAHTNSQVPFIVVGREVVLRGDGVLADVAPTLLTLMGYPKPPLMTGKSLIMS